MDEIILKLTHEEAVSLGVIMDSRRNRLREIPFDKLETGDREILKKDINFVDSFEKKLKDAICKSVTDDPTARVTPCYNVVTGDK